MFANLKIGVRLGVGFEPEQSAHKLLLIVGGVAQQHAARKAEGNLAVAIDDTADASEFTKF
jgi:hypothetical protein